MHQSEIIFRVNDHKERPIITIRENGQASFYRYADMEPQEKDVILRYFSVLKNQGHLSEDENGQTINDIKAYLDYETGQDFCG